MAYMIDSKSIAVQVRSHLIALGLETPMLQMDKMALSDNVKKIYIEGAVSEILSTLGLDLNDNSLKDTPKRVAKMYIDQIFGGLNYSNFPKITTILNSMNVDQMILIKDIDVSSTCEHHLIVIDGAAKIAYIPKDNVLGLSKFNRIVDFFARRPQVQERLTQQISETLKCILQTDNVAVQITAKHYCVKARGIRDINSITKTCNLSGVFKNDSTVRNEFLMG